MRFPSDLISQLVLTTFVHRFQTVHLPSIQLYHFRKMLFPSRKICLAAPILAFLSCTLVTAVPRQTAAPVKARQASTDTIAPDSDEDPDFSIDNTDKLRNGMNNDLASSGVKLILTISREGVDVIHKSGHSNLFTDLDWTLSYRCCLYSIWNRRKELLPESSFGRPPGKTSRR